MPEALIIPLDAESVKKLLGNAAALLKNAPGVEEIGDDYIVVVVPRLFGFGKRKVKLTLRTYEAQEAVLIVMRSGIESIVIAMDIVDTGEGTHIVVSGGGSGNVAKLVDQLVNTVRKNVESRISAAHPRIDLVDSDNRLAALEEPLPPRTTLVYFDSFTPVRDVPEEAGLRLLAIMGIDDYLTEITDYRGVYLARFVLRGNKLTGAYAEIGGRKAYGDEALALAKRPPGHRVKVKAWSLTGSSEIMLYEPEQIVSKDSHSLYWIGGSAKLEHGGLAPNTYVIVDNYEAMIVDPAGGERMVNTVRGVIGDMEQLRYVLATSAEADVEEGLRSLADLALRAAFVMPSYWGAQLASVNWDLAPRVQMLPERETKIKLGKTEILVIPSRSRGAPVASVYVPSSKTLITGPVMGVVTPPGMWSVRIDNLDDYIDSVKSYITHTNCSVEFHRWLDRVRRLDIEVLAPRYGPVIEGRDNVKRLLDSLAEEF